jgi:hypothetical protein
MAIPVPSRLATRLTMLLQTITRKLSSRPKGTIAAFGIFFSMVIVTAFLVGADSGPSRTVIPAHCGQQSGDCGQFLMSV